MITLYLLLFSLLPINTFAVSDVSLDFLKDAWSKENLYPDWYGGRYLTNHQEMVYVIVAGYEDQVADIIHPPSRFVVKKYSYNKLMATLNEIGEEWMKTQPNNEVVCLQSAGLDEFNNCIAVELYTGSDKVATMRTALTEHFGALISVSTSDSLIETALLTTNDHIYWFFISVALAALIVLFFLWRKQTSSKKVWQLSNGDVDETSYTVVTAGVVSAIKTDIVTPDACVFETILRDIE